MMNFRAAVSTHQARQQQPTHQSYRHQQQQPPPPSHGQQPPHGQQRPPRYMQQQQQQQAQAQYTHHNRGYGGHAHYTQSRPAQQTQGTQMQPASVSSKPASQAPPKPSSVSTQTQTAMSPSQQVNTASNLAMAAQQTQSNQQQQQSQQQAVSTSSVQTGSMGVSRTSAPSQTQPSPSHQQQQQQQQQVSPSQQGGQMQAGGASATPSADMQSAGVIDRDVDKSGHGQDGVMQNDVDQQSQQSLASGTTPKKKPFSSSMAVNSKIIFGTKYEVKCDETFAYYEGYVYDYDEKEQKLKVAYSWKDDQSVPVNYVRPVAPPLDPHWKPKQGDHVECQAKAEESEPYGWWDCVIKTVRDSLYLITYEGWENHHEVLQHNMLRPYNDQEPFEDTNIIRDSYDLRDDRHAIEEFKQAADLSNQSSLNYPSLNFEDEDKGETRMDELRRIAKQTGLIHLNFNPAEEKLVLIGTIWAVQDAKMLIRFASRLRRTYRDKEMKAKQQERENQRQYDELCKCEQVKFKFHPNLTGYVIGKNGKNIDTAKQIKGVKHINVNIESSEVLILATDRNAAEEARHVLEMAQDYELIPNDQALIRELIGGGTNIKELEEKSKVIKISTLQHLRSRPPRERDYRDRGIAAEQQMDADGNMQPSPRGRFNQSFIDEPECEDEQYQKLIIIGPKEQVDYAKIVIRQNLDVVQQRLNFLQRRKAAREESRQGQYDNNYGGGEYYEDNMDDMNAPMNGGQGQQPSARRQRRQQQRMTEMSNNDTSQYNYTSSQRGNNAYAQQDDSQHDPEFPSLRGGRKSRGGAGGGGRRGNQYEHQTESKEVSHEDEEHGHTPWHEIDEMHDHEHDAEEEYGDDHDMQHGRGHGGGAEHDDEQGDEYGSGAGGGAPRRGKRGGRRGGDSGSARGRGRGYGGGWDNYGYSMEEEDETYHEAAPEPAAPTKYVQKWQVKQKPNADANASAEQ